MPPSPLDMRGRMMGLLGICFGAGTPVGTAIGAAGAAFGIKLAISGNLIAGLLLFLPVLATTPLGLEKLSRSRPTPLTGDAGIDGL